MIHQEDVMADKELELKMERWRYPRFFTENISETAAVLTAENEHRQKRML